MKLVLGYPPISNLHAFHASYVTSSLLLKNPQAMHDYIFNCVLCAAGVFFGQEGFIRFVLRPESRPRQEL